MMQRNTEHGAGVLTAQVTDNAAVPVNGALTASDPEGSEGDRPGETPGGGGRGEKSAVAARAGNSPARSASKPLGVGDKVLAEISPGGFKQVTLGDCEV